MFRRILYCYLAARPAPGHDGHVIAPYILLPVAVLLRYIAAPVAAGDLPQHAVAHVADKRGVLQVEIRDQTLPAPAYVLDMASGVVHMVLRAYVLRGVAAGDILALKAGHGGGVEHVLRVAVDPHQPVRVALQLQLGGAVVHFAGPGDRHVVADEEAIRRGGHVGGDAVPVVGKHWLSPRKIKWGQPAGSPAG